MSGKGGFLAEDFLRSRGVGETAVAEQLGLPLGGTLGDAIIDGALPGAK